MKTSLLPLLAASFCILFSGCPYSSEVPIDEPSVKLDEKLLGLWESKSSSDDKFNVTKEDAFTCRIEKTSKSSTEPTVYKGYLSQIDGTRFLNVYEENATTKTYYLYKFDISSSGAKATLAPVTDNIDEKFESSGDLKTFLRKHKDLSFLYQKEEDVFIKAD